MARSRSNCLFFVGGEKTSKDCKRRQENERTANRERSIDRLGENRRRRSN